MAPSFWETDTELPNFGLLLRMADDQLKEGIPKSEAKKGGARADGIDHSGPPRAFRGI